MKLRPTAKAARDGAVPILADSLAPSLAESLATAIDHLRNERVDEAEPALNAILQRWPDQPDALHFKGVLLHTRGEMDEAVALIRRALALVPDLPSAWNNLGNVLQLARRPDEAAEAYEQAVHHAPTAQEGAMALNNLGNLTIPFMYGVHVFTKSAYRSSRAAHQSNKVYPPRLSSRALAGIAARRINADR